MSEITYFISIDGDKVGRHIEQLILTANLCELLDFTQKISDAIETLGSIVLEAGGKIYMKGGDNLLAETNNFEVFLSQFVLLREELACSFCIGIAGDPVMAYIALKFAKSCAHGTIIQAAKIDEKINFIKLTV